MKTSTAIVLGLGLAGVLIGAGLYLGLRHRAPGQQTPSVRPAAPAGAATSTVPESRRPAATAKDVAKQAAAALEPHRRALVQACWPEKGGGQRAGQARYVWNFTFDASGKQITRGISEDRSNPHLGTASCLSQKLPPIQVPPPGRVIHVEVPFQLP